MTKTLNQLLFPLGRFWIYLFFLGIWLILFLNSLHETYPDEFDNILGGLLITKGVLPYVGFFSHHSALSYFLSAIVTFFSGQSFVQFRFLSTFFFLGIFLMTFVTIRKRVLGDTRFLYLFFTLLSIGATYFWGHMFLADSLSAVLILPAIGLLFLKIYYEEALKTADLAIISIFSSLTLLNSQTYVYAIFILDLVAIVYYLKEPILELKKVLKKIAIFTIIFAIPYLFFAIYLFLTGSIQDYFFQAVTYNQRYYIYNYPRPAGSTSFNPIRYAVVIFNSFVNNFQPLLAGLINTNFRFPFTSTLGISNLVLWLFLFVRRKFLLLFLVIFVLIYANARANPIDVRATDYQAAVYVVLTFFYSSFILFSAPGFLEKYTPVFKRALLTSLLIAFCFFWFFNGIFLASDFWRMNYSRYMGEKPLIYDRPVVAPVLNELLSPKDYCWVGPFEFEEMFYLDCSLPSKYHWILPQFAGINSIKNDLVDDYSTKKPAIIVFNRNFSAFGQSNEFNKFFVSFLDANYVRLKDVNPNLHFASSKRGNFNFDEDFNFEKSKSEELINALIELRHVVAQRETALLLENRSNPEKMSRPNKLKSAPILKLNGS